MKMANKPNGLTRRSFCTASAAALASLFGCSGAGGVQSVSNLRLFDGKVIIVGAGPAGMTAAHLLQQRGVNFQVIEAADSVGGEQKTT